MNKILKLYNQISKLPFGNFIFSKGLSFRAPYFSTIKPFITELKSGFCRVEVKDRRGIQNHIGSVNAGALCTLSELVGGLAVEATISSKLRWIPKEMTVQYSKKAVGKLTGTCLFDPKILEPGDIKIPFDIKDESGDSVLKTSILFYISERKAKS